MTIYTVEPNRPLHQHFQDGQNECGPACVQMIAGSLLGVTTLAGSGIASQEDIRNFVNGSANNWPNWHTTPAQAAAALNKFSPQSHQGGWMSVECDTENELLARIAAAMREFGTPAMVTDGKEDHWIVVDRIEVSEDLVSVAFKDPDLGPYAQPTKWRQHSYCDSCQSTRIPQLGGGTWPRFDTMVTLPGNQDKAVGIVFGQSQYVDIWQVFNNNKYESGPRKRYP